ncbi:thiamine pyrophosphate-binding protein [Maribellus maritimus]|uniref:thiamine pyrophosphate-binding protein n=1 Tax=Maribellus maritimus TaxID=2870838 RepID=UPI001EE9EC90|nr:thiamine pyrophosphate-binding protein [Maribellus maritimus]MCG6186125.1 thiamine pyrophosphate-binding protein [Maribellus maritimus]
MATVARQFAQTLKEIGVRYVFGVPSGNMIDYIKALREEENIDFILVGHETTAAFMAGAVGRLTGVPGVCFGTFGPGATNLSTGVGGAFLDRFPMIAFTDEMPENLLHRTVQMNIDHQQLFKPITKHTTRFNTENVREIILKAAGIAISEYPGPVHVGVPAGIGQTEIRETEVDVNYLQLKKDLSQKTPDESIQEAKMLFLKAEKPILAVGLSAVRADIKPLLLQLAERFHLPVVLTPMAKGMFAEKHLLYAGVLFHALSDKVALTYQQADLVIGIGYDPVEFNYEDWMPKVPLIHFDEKEADVDITQTGKVVNILGELKTSIPQFSNYKQIQNTWNLKNLQIRKNILFHALTPQPNHFGPLNIVTELRNTLPENGILTVDVGAHLHLIGQMWQTPSPEKLLITNGWSSMGFGIPAALAAKLCHPGLEVACVTGDGGFLMNAGELATAKRLNLKIVFIVIYDNSLSLIKIKQEKKNFATDYGTPLDMLSEEATNHYFGVPVIRIRNQKEYKNALQKAFIANGPTVIEAVADGDEYKKFVLKPNK